MELAGQNSPQACLDYSAGICNAFTEMYRHHETSTFSSSLPWKASAAALMPGTPHSVHALNKNHNHGISLPSSQGFHDWDLAHYRDIRKVSAVI